MNKDFNEFRKLINEQELVAKIIEKSPLGKGITIKLEQTPDGLEKYQCELAQAIVGTAMVATVDFLQVYHQWVTGDLDKGK